MVPALDMTYDEELTAFGPAHRYYTWLPIIGRIFFANVCRPQTGRRMVSLVQVRGYGQNEGLPFLSDHTEDSLQAALAIAPELDRADVGHTGFTAGPGTERWLNGLVRKGPG